MPATTPTFQNPSSLFIRRWALFVLGAYLMGLGVAMTTNAHLGTTPISSLPYVCSLVFPLSLGTFTFLINILFVVAQKILLGPAFGRMGLLQLPAVTVFGLFIDLNMWLTAPLISETYPLQMLLCVSGSMVLGLGIAVCIASNATVQPGEGIILAICHRWHRNFGRIKVCFDCSLVLMAAIVSLLAIQDLVGLREGTVVSAILTGNFVRIFAPVAKRLAAFV